jgi:nucleoside-diphosphate-sugar epimerase
LTSTIFVTGGTGFLGRHLIPTLCRAGYHVRVLARHPEAHAWLTRYPQVSAVQGDVLDPTSLAPALDGCDYVIHAAGLFRFWGEQALFDATNVGGTENVLKAANGVQRFVHVSTVALIGTPSGIVDEEHPAHPADNYQRSKYKAEQLALRYHADHGVPLVVLRPGAFYGPLGSYAFNRLFFRDPMRGIIMQINGGSYITFPAYIGDVAQAIVRALTAGRPGEIYNVCGETLTHQAAFDIITREAGLWYPRLNIPDWLGEAFARFLSGIAYVTRQEPFYPITLRSYVYNDWRVTSAKAQRELGFVPTPFLEGARRTIAWYRAGQPDTIPEVEC